MYVYGFFFKYYLTKKRVFVVAPFVYFKHFFNTINNNESFFLFQFLFQFQCVFTLIANFNIGHYKQERNVLFINSVTNELKTLKTEKL